jgi:alkylation response protein AidB-like acyl-CoA dehydrogenase
MSTHPSNSDDLNVLVEAARIYAERIGRLIFDGRHADGATEQIAFALEKAFELGLAASPDNDQPGYEFGIWGCAAHDAVLMPSTGMLSTVAEVCGGLAMNLHVQGLASRCITLSGVNLAEPIQRAACAFQEESGPPGFATLSDPLCDAPAHIETEAVSHSYGYTITGTKTFVYALPDPEAFVVLCRVAGTWGCFLVSAEAQGLIRESVGERTGLRACSLNYLTFRETEALLRLDDGNARSLLEHVMSLNWLGIAAIGAGIAEGAVQAARRYAAERYQGGTMIANLPAVRTLMAEAMTNIQAARAMVNHSALHFGADKLSICAMTRLAVLSLSAAAVTDALQVFGGYGYMEDFGMEKRLRDVTVLKSMAGTPQYLKRFIFESKEARK